MTKLNRLRLLGVLLVLPAFARADDAPHYSVKDVPIMTKAFPEQKRSMFIGEYGEAFTYEMEWVLHPPALKDGVEVVRFHSMLTDPSGKLKVMDSDFKAENFTPMNLVELVVMPKTAGQFKDLRTLRDAKAAALAEKGAVFRIEPMGDGKWPESTFTVFISSPYALYQRYAETKGQIFILTTGLKGAGNGSLGYPAGGDFVGALGDYFYKLQPRIDPRTTERPQLGFLKFIAAPLLLLGVFLVAVPWGKKYLRPLALASGTASILGSAVYMVSFYAAQWIDVIGHGVLVSMGVVGWAMIPLFLIAIYLRTRELAGFRKWVVWGASLAATAFLIVVGCAMQDEIARNQATVATAFSTYMFNVGLLYGACLGLASRGGSDSESRAILALIAVLSMFASTPVAAQVTASADRLAAIRKIDSIRSHAVLERIQATQQLRETRDFNEIQTVALDGIFATDENPRQIEKYFNLHLQPSHNNEGKYSPAQPDKSGSWWQRLKDQVGAAEDTGRGMGRDLTDLFVDKSGKLTDRAKEMLAPIADDNTHINTIVAHSWGAVLLQNAIREGIVNPPKRIIVIGVPQRNIQDWKLLAHYTGTDVVVITNSGDRAVAGGQAADELHDTDILGGGERRYDEGKIANDWQHWPQHFGKKNPNHSEGTVESKVVTLDHKDNRLGHSRAVYTQALISNGYLKPKDEMQQDQDSLVEKRFREFREQDIKAEMDNIRAQRATLEAAVERDRTVERENGYKRAMEDAAARAQQKELAEAALQGGAGLARQRSWQLAHDMRQLSGRACTSPGSIAEIDVAGVQEIKDKKDFSDEDRFSAVMSGCEKDVFDRIVELAKSHRLGSGLTADLLRQLGAFYAPPPPKPEPIPVPTPVPPPYFPPSPPPRPTPTPKSCEDYGNRYCP